MKHLIIKDAGLNGWEYGMLRSFEAAIEKETGADLFEIPSYTFAPRLLPYFGQGMNRGVYRRYFPKQPIAPEADVAWYILMGPENYRLDLYKGWDKGIGKKVLYLYDTLPSQYPLIQRLFSNTTWDVLVTSFNDAVEDLQKLTGRKWHCVEQAADAGLFVPAALLERQIHFSSYGRKHPALHEALKEFCSVHGLYYDYTTHDAKHPVVDATELYRQYAWHVSHSLFTFSWPVELTHPQRAGHLRPITCRWFEAAAAGTIIAGQAPGNPAFKQYFNRDIVVPIDFNATRQEYLKSLETLMNKSAVHHAAAAEASRELMPAASWNERVNRIMNFI